MEKKDDDKALFERLKNLYETWPSDGWVGAAAVIAVHAEKAYAVEQEFKLQHESLGKHGLEHPYYKGQCVCRENL